MNDVPVALDDAAATSEDVAVLVDVLANDTDADGDTLSVASTSDPANGTAANNGTDVTYTPDPDFVGVDSFTYLVNDGTVDGNTATVTITVGGVNDPPVAVNDGAATSEDVGIIIDVLANDTDADGDTLSVASTSDPANGSVVNNGGDVTYTPNADFTGIDSFTYVVNDGTVDGNTATVTVTVSAVNDAPVAVDDAVATSEDVAVVVDVLANDTDADGDILSVVSVSDPANGSVVNNGGDVTYTPDADFAGVDSFTYVVNDGTVDGNTATVTVTIGAVNDVPVAIDDAAATSEDVAVVVDVLANDIDADGDTLSVVSVSDPANGSVTNSGSDVTYTPDAEFVGVDSFTYLVKRRHG